MDILGLSLIAPYINLIIKNETTDFFLPIGDYLASSSYDIIYVLSFALVVIYVFKSLFGLFVQYCIIRISKKVQADLAVKLMRIYLEMDYSNYLKRKQGEYFHNIYGLSAAFAQILNTLLRLISEIIISVGILIFLTTINFGILLSLLATFVVSVFVFDFFFKRKLKLYGKIINDAGEEISQTISESMSNFKQIKIINVYKFFLNRLNNHFKKLISASVKAESIAYIPRYTYELITVLFFITLVLVFHTNTLDVSGIIPVLAVFVVGIIRLLPFLTNISSSTSRIRNSINSIDRLYNIVHDLDSYKNKIKKDTSKIQLNKIEFHNVFYKYENSEHYVLENINLKINKGDKIYLKGLSGSGKTTFIDILIGLIHPSKGQIILNDTKRLRDNMIDDYQQNFFYSPQEVYLLNETVALNVSLSNMLNDNSLKNIRNSLIKSEIYDHVKKLENDINSKLSDGGKNLSGGQKQRINISRLFYFNKDILILDEATSAMDKELESRIIKNILNDFKHKTVIIISHRTEIGNLCDRKFLVTNKEIKEEFN